MRKTILSEEYLSAYNITKHLVYFMIFLWLKKFIFLLRISTTLLQYV